jgi:hypothetical protein
MKEAKELAMSIGKAWFAVAVGVLFSAYGFIELIAHSKTTGWPWIVGGLGVVLLVCLAVAHQALRERNAALRSESSRASAIFHGGEHIHLHVKVPRRSSSSSD